MDIKECFYCEFFDPDFGCTCPSYEISYACPALSPSNLEDLKKE